MREIPLHPGITIRNVREDAKMSQRMLAKKSGFHWNSIAKIERGERMPRLGTLMKLYEALKKDPE